MMLLKLNSTYFPYPIFGVLKITVLHAEIRCEPLKGVKFSNGNFSIGCLHIYVALLKVLQQMTEY